jgi:D-alanyl-D-alanine carboxypeptidase (penicillin-binding protein 5/6)
VRIDAPHEVEGPLRRGARLGTASVYVEGRKVGSVPLGAGRAVPKASSLDRARAFFADNWILIVAGVFVILMIALILRYRAVRREQARREKW